MATRPKGNPEKIMILMFPLVTLGVFIAGIVVILLLPQFIKPYF